MTGFIKLIVFLTALGPGDLVGPDTHTGIGVLQQVCQQLKAGEGNAALMSPEELQSFAGLCASYEVTLNLFESAPVLGMTLEMVRDLMSAVDERPPADYLVADVVDTSCTTGDVRGLSEQLIDELECLRPGTLERIDSIPGVKYDAQAGTVFPYLQAPAVAALAEATSRLGKAPLEINSALRTLPQQFIIYSWYRKRRCRIPLASRPGRSHHEHGMALDIRGPRRWLRTLRQLGWRWAGRRDPVHFSFGGEAVDMRELSVLAFQRLWNRNHPDDRVPETGEWSEETAERLAKSPARGFSVGAQCSWSKAKKAGFAFRWLEDFGTLFHDDEADTDTDAAAPQGPGIGELPETTKI